MKKSTLIHVVVMVVAVIAASLLASKLTADQRALLPEKATMSKMPVGGFHKFMADVEWMLFINYMGSQSTVDETNIDEVTRRLERLIALDPNLDKLYQDGVSSISVADPEKTVELLKRACENYHLRNNAEIPFYTGFVMVQYLKPANYKDALDYFKMAMQRSGGGQDGGADHVFRGNQLDVLLLPVILGTDGLPHLRVGGGDKVHDFCDQWEHSFFFCSARRWAAVFLL